MHTLPLVDAIIVATRPSAKQPAQVKVVRFGAPELLSWDLSFGACDSRWRDQPDYRMGFLHEIAWHLAHAFQIPTDTIHRALQAIPEYRALEGNDVRTSAS